MGKRSFLALLLMFMATPVMAAHMIGVIDVERIVATASEFLLRSEETGCTHATLDN